MSMRISQISSEGVQITRGVAFSFVDQVIQFGLAFIVSVLMARIFGAAVLGDFAIIMVLTGSFTAIAAFLGSNGMIRQINAYGRGTPEAARLFWMVLGISLAIGMASFVAFAPLGKLILSRVYRRPDLIVPFSVLLAASVLVNIPTRRLVSAFVAYQEARFLMIARLIMKSINITLVLLLPLIWGDNIGTMVRIIIGTNIAFFLVLVLLLRHVIAYWPNPRTVREGKTDLKHVLWFDLRAFPMSLNELALDYADRGILGYYFSSAYLGAYDRAYALYKQLYVVPFLVSRMVYPSLCRLAHDNNTDKIIDIVSKTMRYLLLVMVPVAFWVAAAAPMIMNIFGEEFMTAAPALSVLVFSIIFDTIGRTSGTVIGSLDRPELFSIITLIGAATNVVLNLVLVPRWGLLGSAIAYLISYALMSLVPVIVITNLLQVGWRELLNPVFLINILVSGSIMGIMVRFMVIHIATGWAILLLLPVGFLIFFVLAFFVGLIDKETIVSLQAVAISVKSMVRNAQ